MAKKYGPDDIEATIPGPTTVYLPVLELFELFNAKGICVSNEGRVDLLVLDTTEGLDQEEAQGFYVWADIEEIKPAPSKPHLSSVN